MIIGSIKDYWWSCFMKTAGLGVVSLRTWWLGVHSDVFRLHVSKVGTLPLAH